ncbi:hypothetical protein QSF18_004776 [Escherichia coli]
MTVFVMHIPVGTGDSGHVWCPLHADESSFTRERVIQLIHASFCVAQHVLCSRGGCICLQLSSKSLFHFCCCHSCNIGCRAVVANNEVAVQDIKWCRIFIDVFQSLLNSQPVARSLQAIQFVPLVSFIRCVTGHTPELLRHVDERIFTFRQTERSEVINAGRQLLMICIYLFSFLSQLVMNIKMLSVPSDRGRQTYRSENVQTVTGILFPTTVRPAPFSLFSYSQVSGSLRGSDAPGGQRDMEVKVCLPQ